MADRISENWATGRGSMVMPRTLDTEWHTASAQVLWGPSEL